MTENNNKKGIYNHDDAKEDSSAVIEKNTRRF